MSSVARGVSCSYADSTTGDVKAVSTIQDKLFAEYFGSLMFVLVGAGVKTLAKMVKNKYGDRSFVAGCGDIRGSYVCTNPVCGKVHYAVHKCLRRSCPDCYFAWVKWTTDAIKLRLTAPIARQIHYKQRLVHIVVSPPKDWLPDSRLSLDHMIKASYGYIRSMGANGGAMIFHPFRATDFAKRQALKYHMKTWDFIRESSDRRLYYYSPHFHFIAYIGHMKPPAASDLFIYKVITDSNNKPINYRFKGVAGLARYLLSHSGYIDGESFNCLRWFGSCSNNKFSVEKEVSDVTDEPVPVCRICNSVLEPVWIWARYNMYNINFEGSEPPEFFDEILSCLNGEPPPRDAVNYVV